MTTANLASRRRRQKKYMDGRKEWTKIYSREWNLRLRKDAIFHYTKGEMRCACCYERHIQFLTIDHIAGGGSRHRKSINNLYVWLRNNGYPEGFRILCMNCNFARGVHGGCPHGK